MADRTVNSLSRLARQDRHPDTDEVLNAHPQLEIVPEAVKRAKPLRARKPRGATPDFAYKGGRMARRRGDSKDSNPYRMPEAERTNTSDALMYKWDAGYDFEVC
jgi:hypothetical protein